ncbi:MAG TPA: hypothetical protein VMY35_06145 [Phycisphaerae bacterium]|nr:hypothetical protein [Phycisphaerae bacterium]
MAEQEIDTEGPEDQETQVNLPAGPGADDAGKVAEIDWTKAEPTAAPHSFVEQTAAFQGIRSELMEARENLRQTQAANQALSEELAAGKSGGADEDPLAEVGDDELLTVGQARNFVQKTMDTERRTRERDSGKAQQAHRQQVVVDSEARLRTRYSPEKSPKGLDAETVIREGATWLRQNKPHVFAACLQGADPAQEMYDTAVAIVPSLRQRLQVQEREKFIKDLNRGRVPGSTGGLTKGEQQEASELLALLNADESTLGAMFEDAIDFGTNQQ